MKPNKIKAVKATKLYEINGVITYAHIIYDEIEAKSSKEALSIAKKKDYSDPAIAEKQDQIIDTPILISPIPTKSLPIKKNN